MTLCSGGLALARTPRPAFKQGLRRDGFDLFAEANSCELSSESRHGFASVELHRASVGKAARRPQSTAPSTVARTQTSVSPPVMMTVSIPPLRSCS